MERRCRFEPLSLLKGGLEGDVSTPTAPFRRVCGPQQERSCQKGSHGRGRWTVLFPASLQVMGFEARNLARARMIRGPTSTWWLGRPGNVRRTCCGERPCWWFVPRRTPEGHLSCRETGIAATAGRDGPTSSGAGSGLTWMEGGFRPPVKGSKLVRLELGGPPIWATSIARSWGRRLDGLAKARSCTGGAGQITSSD